MAVDKSVFENSLNILQQIGLVPESYQMESLWSVDFSGEREQNSVVTVE